MLILVWNDLKYFLCTEVKPNTLQQLTDEIHLFWNNHANNLEYCNKKIDHIVNTVVDKVILLTGAATGL